VHVFYLISLFLVAIIKPANEKFMEEHNMAKSKSDYFGLGRVVSLILAIIPFTAWICGAITRFTEGKIVAGLIRLIFGFTIVWICDLVLMIISKHILRLINV